MSQTSSRTRLHQNSNFWLGHHQWMVEKSRFSGINSGDVRWLASGERTTKRHEPRQPIVQQPLMSLELDAANAVVQHEP